MNKREFLQGVLLAAIPVKLFAQAVNNAASIVGVRLWPAADYTRITLEYDGVIESNVFTLNEPQPRLVIDITGLQLNDTLREMSKKIAANDPFVAGLRVGQHTPSVLRLVFDLKQRVVPQVVRSPAIAGFKNRLMVDVSPEKADAVAAWLNRNEKQASETSGLKTSPILEKPPEDKPLVKPVEKPAAPSVIVKNKKILVIDPGHGGEDPGAVGLSGLKEKDVVLSISRLLVDFASQDKNWQVYLTRDADYFVPLAQRVKKARAAKAHVMVSIHADAFTTPKAHGASVFALSSRGASSSAARWLANKENEADLVGGLDLSAQDALAASVLLDMSTTAQIKTSLGLGGAVLRQLERFAKLHKPRVEQAGFAVLKAPDVPSILVETAFISNPEEEKRLSDKDYQAKLARAIWRGLRA